VIEEKAFKSASSSELGGVLYTLTISRRPRAKHKFVDASYIGNPKVISHQDYTRIINPRRFMSEVLAFQSRDLRKQCRIILNRSRKLGVRAGLFLASSSVYHEDSALAPRSDSIRLPIPFQVGQPSDNPVMDRWGSRYRIISWIHHSQKLQDAQGEL